MNSGNNFSKKINKMQRRVAKRPRPTAIAPTEVPQTPSLIDVGNWRIAEGEDGSLIIYNFETGNSIILARP